MGDFKVFFGTFFQLQAFRPVLGIPGGCNLVGKLNSQILEGPRCFGPHRLTLRGSMGDFKVFFGPFFQLQAFRPVLGIPGGCNFVGKLNSQILEGPRCF